MREARRSPLALRISVASIIAMRFSHLAPHPDLPIRVPRFNHRSPSFTFGPPTIRADPTRSPNTRRLVAHHPLAPNLDNLICSSPLVDCGDGAAILANERSWSLLFQDATYETWLLATTGPSRTGSMRIKTRRHGC